MAVRGCTKRGSLLGERLGEGRGTFEASRGRVTLAAVATEALLTQ